MHDASTSQKSLHVHMSGGGGGLPELDETSMSPLELLGAPPLPPDPPVPSPGKSTNTLPPQPADEAMNEAPRAARSEKRKRCFMRASSLLRRLRATGGGFQRCGA